MIIVLLIIVVTEFLNGNRNEIDLSIMFIFCATIVTLPLVQFIVAKKYK